MKITKTKIKLFESNYIDSLEDAVNTWIDEKYDIDIKDIKYNCFDGKYSAMVIYKPNWLAINPADVGFIIML